jgi:hypothetical protein
VPARALGKVRVIVKDCRQDVVSLTRSCLTETLTLTGYNR